MRIDDGFNSLHIILTKLNNLYTFVEGLGAKHYFSFLKKQL